jgi:hypothetical protein
MAEHHRFMYLSRADVEAVGCPPLAIMAAVELAFCKAPIIATSDPLPAAFNATLGRVLPIGGTDGVALLLTVVVELISGFGLAALTVLSVTGTSICLRGREREAPSRSLRWRPHRARETRNWYGKLPPGRDPP